MDTIFEFLKIFEYENISLNDYKEEKREGFLLYSKETIPSNSVLENIYKEGYPDINTMKENYIYRYYYYEKLNNDCKKHAIIIMMNPAFANSDKPDPTIKNIKKYCNKTKKENEIGSFEVINLYPIRMPKSVKLSELLENEAVKEVTTNYQNVISKYLEGKAGDDNVDIIAAWGCNDTDNDKAKELFRELDLILYCYAINEKGYPRHFRSLKNKELKKLQDFKFD